MKILIVDDDTNILLGLKYIIENRFSKDVHITISSDALEALEICRFINPDVIITDIKMPGMSGLELLRTIKTDLGFDGSAIIISGYEDFSYAKNAIALGAVDYLLKPIIENELINHLINIRNSKIQKEQIKHSSKDDTWKTKYILIAQLIHKLYVFSDTVINVFDKNVFFRICIFKISNKNSKISKYIQLLATYYSDENIFAYCNQNHLTLVLTGNTKSEVDILADKHIQEHNNLFVLTQSFSDIDKMSLVHSIALNILEYNYMFDLQLPFLISKKELNRVDITIAIAIKESWIISEFLMSIKNKSMHLLDKAFTQMDNLLNRDGTVFLTSTIRSMLSNIIKSIAEYTSEHESIYIEASGEMWHLVEITSSARYSTICSRLYHILLKVCYPKCEDNGIDELIGKVIYYIHSNYTDTSLSLKSVSEHFYINPCYLSSLFHKKTGKRFWTYVQELRLNKANILLATTDLSIQLVSDKVGFNNIKTFYKAYKNKVAMTPNEYRDQNK